MKKSLLALAILGAFAGGAAAQANLTLYGIADVGIGMADTDGPGSDSAVNVFDSVQSSSRLGIRGSEDLGNGLKAVFNIEAAVNYDTGAASSRFWGRRAVVGLAGGFGEIRLGRDYTPGRSVIGKTDVMDLGLFGNWLTFSDNGGVTSRASNGLHYTGKFGGVTLRAMYASGEADNVSTPSGDGDMVGVSAVYEGGPLTVQGYYQSREFDNGTGGTDSADEYGLGAQYRFGGIRVALNYGMADTDQPAGGSVEHQAIGLGLGAKLGSGELLFNYIRQEVDAAGDPEAKSFAIAYVHPLSKRTNLYATYGQLKNEGGAAFELAKASGSVGGAADTTPKAFAVGVRHRF
ncbi:porin [Burkholderiaceae bacterium FT117]|uniref:porin n=1 Tax=Zeimonas sediminis TaxID=2944268 RepID=UPI002342FE4E|nr:porin [Zeimonas sediminis]MCM5572435.1 porin [Zeimonas sediminis]